MGEAMSEVAQTPAGILATLVSEAGRRHPYPHYEALRRHGELIRVKPDLVVTVGYRECDRALREPKLRVQDAASFEREYPPWRAHSSLRAYADSMLYRNPPDHGRMRGLVSGGFTARRVAAMRQAVEELAERLLDELAEAGGAGAEVDFIGEFASRLPIAVISRLLGVPEHDHAWFRAVAADITIALEGITSVGRLAPADRSMDELADYFRALIDDRRSRPTDDLVSALVQMRGHERALSADELVGNLMLMLTAGFETTSFLLGHGLLLALARPELGERLRTEPDLAVGYVEELLRYEPPVQATSRWSGAALELCGHRLEADTKVVIILAAGNRDPRRYPRPEVFDPDRRDVQPLSFGAGGHFCLGAPLARMEAQIALPRLLRRFPRLAAAGPPKRRDTWVGRGLDHFPVTLT